MAKSLTDRATVGRLETYLKFIKVFCIFLGVMIMVGGSQVHEAQQGFQYVADSKSGLSTFYDVDKCAITEVTELPITGNTKVKLYRVVPTDSEHSSILHVVAHLPSGASKEDQRKRDVASAEVNALVSSFLQANPQYKDVVYSMDANVSSFVCKKGGNSKNVQDYVTNESGIVHGLNTLLPADLVVEQFATSKDLVLKMRAEDMGNNQQLDKAGLEDISCKSWCVHAKVSLTKQELSAREQKIKEVLKEVPLPEKILKFGQDQTYGSDHLDTIRLEVNSLGFVVFPLLNTFGARGYHDPSEYYNLARVKAKEILESSKASTDALLDIIIEELRQANVSQVTINDEVVNINTLTKQGRGSNRLVRKRAEFIKVTEKYLVNRPGVIEKIVKQFAESPEFRRWENFVKEDKKKFANDAEQQLCVSRIRNKNYDIKEIAEGSVLTDPNKEFIHVQLGRNNISYRLTTLDGLTISGKVNYDVPDTVDKLDTASKQALRKLIIEEATAKIAVQPHKAANFASDYTVLKQDVSQEQQIGVSFGDSKDGKFEIKYTAIAPGGIKYTGTIWMPIDNTNNISPQDWAQIQKSILENLRAKPELAIYNGKDIVGQISEYVDRQPFAGFEFNLETHPRQLQLAKCATLVVSEKPVGFVDVISVTENSDMSHLKGNSPDAVLARNGYTQEFKKEMTQTCKKMTEHRNDALEALSIPISDFQYKAQLSGLGLIYDNNKMQVIAIPVPLDLRKLGIGKDAKDLKISVAKIIPRDPFQPPFIQISYHAASGAAAKDKAQRKLEWEAINKLAESWLANPLCNDCTKVVVAGDLNVSAYVGRPGTTLENRQHGSDYEVNKAELNSMATALSGSALVLTDCSTAAYILKKMRVKGNLWLNQQTTKGGTFDEDSKAGVLVFERRSPGTNLASAINSVLDNIKVPQEPVRVFGKDDTEGSDHAPTIPLEVNRVPIEVRALIKTNGMGGYFAPLSVYKKPLTAEDRNTMSRSSDYLFALLKEEIYKSAPNLRAQGEQITDFIENAEFINTHQSKLFDWQSVAGSSQKVMSQKARDNLAELLKTWINSKDYKAVTALLIEPKVPDTKAIKGIIEAIENKGKDIANTIAEQFGMAQVSAGYEPLMGDTPRAAQIKALKEGAALTVVTENGLKAHKTTEKDMQEVVRARNAETQEALDKLSNIVKEQLKDFSINDNDTIHTLNSLRDWLMMPQSAPLNAKIEEIKARVQRDPEFKMLSRTTLAIETQILNSILAKRHEKLREAIERSYAHSFENLDISKVDSLDSFRTALSQKDSAFVENWQNQLVREINALGISLEQTDFGVIEELVVQLIQKDNAALNRVASAIYKAAAISDKKANKLNNKQALEAWLNYRLSLKEESLPAEKRFAPELRNILNDVQIRKRLLNPLLTKIMEKNKTQSQALRQSAVPVPAQDSSISNDSVVSRSTLFKSIAGFAVVGVIVGASIAVAAGLAWPVVLGIAVATGVGLGVTRLAEGLFRKEVPIVVPTSAGYQDSKAPAAYAESSAKKAPTVQSSIPTTQDRSSEKDQPRPGGNRAQ